MLSSTFSSSSSSSFGTSSNSENSQNNHKGHDIQDGEKFLQDMIQSLTKPENDVIGEGSDNDKQCPCYICRLPEEKRTTEVYRQVCYLRSTQMIYHSSAMYEKNKELTDVHPDMRGIYICYYPTIEHAVHCSFGFWASPETLFELPLDQSQPFFKDMKSNMESYDTLTQTVFAFFIQRPDKVEGGFKSEFCCFVIDRNAEFWTKSQVKDLISFEELMGQHGITPDAPTVDFSEPIKE